MSSTQPYDDPSFLKEVWGLFGVGCGIMALRFTVRTRAVGIRGYEGDDWMAIAVLLCYAADAITVEICYKLGTNVDFPVEQLEAFTQRQRDRIRFGSKMQLLAWFTYTALIWGLKAQMLFFYNRLTFGLRQQFFVRVMGVVCAVTYVAVFLTITLGCYPTRKNWQVLPSPGLKCTFKPQNLYVTTILNVLTDALVLAIPVPLLWALQVPKRQKIALVLLLCSGMFVIAAALIRVSMTLVGTPSALTVNAWGVRETVAGIVAVNIPIIRPVFSKAFWSRDFPPGSRKGKSKGSTLHTHSRSTPKPPRHSRFGKLSAYEMDEDMQTAIDHRNSSDDGKKYSQQTTVVELDNASTSDCHPGLPHNRSSEELVIQKPGNSGSGGSSSGGNEHSRVRNLSRQQSRNVLYNEEDEDLEAAHRPPMEVSVGKRYEIRPSARVGSGRGGGPGGPGGRQNWDEGWARAGYGSRTVIGAGEER